jgi:hypothetical protein
VNGTGFGKLAVCIAASKQLPWGQLHLVGRTTKDKLWPSWWRSRMVLSEKMSCKLRP